MLAHLCRRLSALPRLSTPFSTTATRDSLDYYKILQVDTGATAQAIRKAYAQLTTGLIPERDTKQFKILNQAFVILTDNKTRDAYDSLLSVRKTNYLSPEESSIPATKSYLATRRANKLDELKKKLNIDQFGRYKGGLPSKRGDIRRKSLDITGRMHQAQDIEDALNTHPQFHNVTQEKAESFKNFHQDQREARTMKWPWFSFQVDYEYFTFRKFRKSYWPKLQLFILLIYIIPTLYYAIERIEKGFATQHLKDKALKAQQKAEEAHHAQPQASKQEQASS